MRYYPLNRAAITLLAAWLGSFTFQAQLVTGLTAVDVGAPPLPGSTTVNAPGSFAVAEAGEYKNSDFADINRDGYDDFFVADMLGRQHQRRTIQLAAMVPGGNGYRQI